MILWLQLAAQLAALDYVTTGENKGLPHLGLTPWGDLVGGLYPGQQTRVANIVANIVSTEVVGSVV